MCRGSHGIHRVIEGHCMTYLDDYELAKVQHMMYYCHECCAYHVRGEFTVGDVVKALSPEEVPSE